ncbi:MAG: sigma-54 dependent transcriptional regulator, partial [Myxococcota bacterium]
IHGRAPRGAISLLKGNSSAMRELLETIRDLAPLPDTLLIRGESGVGKELVARAVHEQSMVREGPFVAVNCAAIKPELFESELFGHRAGAFTGATRERSGLIESAQNGTLFLDEIGELSSDLQAKLLRLLEQREYRRVGAEQRRLLEARVVAATHVDLETAIEARRFRQDLYFRLSALELRVPPLRDRRDDIQLLAYHFLNKYNHRYDRSVDRIAPRALRLLENADWKRNNVRELEWSIRQAVARCKNQRELTVESFRDRVIPGAAPISLPRPAHQAPMAVDRGDVLDISDLLDVNYGEAIKDLRRRFATRYAERCLQVANYNKSRAAEIAGMKRSNFSRLIKDLELKIPEPLPMKA